MYAEIADWFHLLTAPEEYAEEAEFYWRTLAGLGPRPPRTLLELGAGGGNNAWHYKQHVKALLVDLSPRMLALSQQINPECEHHVGDMRDLRLGREFDAVFIHDALGYMTSLEDLRRTFETAYVHLRAGGVAVFAPDHTRENFRTGVDCGGHDDPSGRGLRYLEWTFDTDPRDSVYEVDYAYLLREPGQPTRTVYDRHTLGLFSRQDWLRLLSEVGFVQAEVRPFEHSEVPSGSLEIFTALKAVAD
jgi:SAM-dependent methyltransferase